MPSLFECKNCGARSWNRTPNVEFCLIQSVHVLRDGRCPVCGSDVAVDFEGESRKLPAWERTIFGPGVVTADFKTAPGSGRAREDHYVFAHQVLRELAFSNPPMFFGTLLSGMPEPGFPIQSGWRILHDRMQVNGGPFELDIQQISVDLFSIYVNAAKTPCLVVSLPQPLHVAESYFVGVSVPNFGALTASDRSEVDLMFATLEVASPEVSPSRTVLGRWLQANDNDDYKHRNYSSGPPPQDPFQFVEYVERLMSVVYGPFGGSR